MKVSSRQETFAESVKLDSVIPARASLIKFSEVVCIILRLYHAILVTVVFFGGKIPQKARTVGALIEFSHHAMFYG